MAGICTQIDPTTFTLALDDDTASVLVSDLDDTDAIKRAVEAEESCPMTAISVEIRD